MELSDRLVSWLTSAKSALILGVGGGNDSVTALLLREQLRKAPFSFNPGRLDIAAMLPDCLDYSGYRETGLPNVWEITPGTGRAVQGIRVTGFPEPILARNTDRFGLGHVWGLDMARGSEGIANALAALCQTQFYDLILACDIGGDFIAAPENFEVLSPMMDGYALHALRRLPDLGVNIPVVGAVFALGTDGESSPEMLAKALTNVGDSVERSFDSDLAPEVERFYREEVEPNRYSRTADFTLQEIRGVGCHQPVESYRVRYHSRPDGKRRRSYTGNFDHAFASQHYGKFYLFADFSGVQNPFAVKCDTAVEWLIQVTAGRLGPERVHHEMVGQRVVHEGREVLFAVPSRKFSREDQESIFADTVASVKNHVYDAAFVYSEDIEDASVIQENGLSVLPVNEHLSLLYRTGDFSPDVLYTRKDN